MEFVAVGHPSGCDQESVGPQGLGSAGVTHIEGDPTAGRAGGGDGLRLGQHPEALPVSGGERLAHIEVLGPQQPRPTVHDRHLAAGRAEDVGHLGRDVAPAPDQQALGNLSEAHDIVGGEVLHRGEVRVRRDEGPGPCGEHHRVAGDLRAVHLEAPGAAEAGLALVHGDVLEPAPVVLAGGRDGVDAPEDAVGDLGPAHPGQFRGDAQPAGVAHRLGHVGNVHEHLGGDAAPVQARPTEVAALHDGHPPSVHLGCQQRVARARPDDDEIEVRHGSNPTPTLPRPGPIRLSRHRRGTAGSPGAWRGWGASVVSAEPSVALLNLGAPAGHAEAIRTKGCR